MNKKNKSRPLSLTALLVLVIVLAISFCLSAFVSSDYITNRFTASSLDIALIQENYDKLTEKQRSELIPNRTLPKDSKVKNTDETDAFVFLKITVPIGTVTDVSEDGTRTVKQSQELFWIKTEQNKANTDHSTQFNTDASDNNEYWVELPDCKSGTDLSGETRTYVFGYSVYLKPDETSETLFDYVQLKNTVQYEVNANSVLTINVQAYGIQADYLDDIDKDNAGEKAVMTVSQLTEIFGYINDTE